MQISLHGGSRWSVLLAGMIGARTLLVGLLVAGCAWSGEIAGVVADDRKQEPLRRALVEVVAGEAGARYTTLTDPDGRFRLRDLPEGRYRIFISKRGYLPFSGAAGELGPAFVNVSNDTSADGLRILLRLPGTISGQVTDEEGAGFVAARVRARRITRHGDETRFTWTANERADDEGRFRLFGLPPGRYIVDARPPPRPAQGEVVQQPALDDPGGLRLDDEYLPLYHPGSLIPSQAAPISLGAGVDYSGVHLRLEPHRALRIRGSVTRTVGKPRIDLIAVGFGGTVEYLEPSSVEEGRSFTFRGLSPGSYVLVAQSGSAADWRGAIARVELTDTPIDDVELRLAPGVRVHGEVRTSGPVAGDDLFTARIRLTPVDLPGDLEIETVAKRGGRFDLTRTLPGRYRVSASAWDAEEREYYAATARLGAGPADDNEIFIEDTPDERAALVIELARCPTLSGVVLRAGDTPVVVGWQTAIDAPATMVATDAEGRFYFTGLHAGEGRLLAYHGFDPNEHGGERFWRNAWTRGLALKLEEAGEHEAPAEVIVADSLR